MNPLSPEQEEEERGMPSPTPVTAEQEAPSSPPKPRVRIAQEVPQVILHEETSPAALPTKPGLGPEQQQQEQSKPTPCKDTKPEAAINKNVDSSTRHLIDDRMGGMLSQAAAEATESNRSLDQFRLLQRLRRSLQHQRFFLFASLAIVVLWSCFCVWAVNEYLRDRADAGNNRAADWLEWLEGAGSKFRMIGILFVFALVFRFNRCYDRWNQGRIIWGRIVAVSTDVTRMASYWIVDDRLADRFCRFVVVLPYATKALLRGNALSDGEQEEGPALMERGFLTREELMDMDEYPGWQTHWCLDMLSVIWTEVHYHGDSTMFDSNHKVYSQLYRAIEACISNLNSLVGDAVRVRASGLPETYDALHHVMFYFYFSLAPIFYAPTVGWTLPIIIGLESLLIMLLVVMGSDLVQPFGTDRVDLPLEFFCETIEVQVQQIRQRAKRGTLQRLSRTSTPATNPFKVANQNHRKTNSMSRSIKGDQKKNEHQYQANHPSTKPHINHHHHHHHNNNKVKKSTDHSF